MAGSISATTAALISAAVGAAGVGTGLYESHESSVNQSNALKAQQQAQQAQANQANLTKQEAVLGEQGQAQQQTGGSLTDSGTAALTDLLAGYPGFQGGPASGTSTGTGIGASGVSGNNSGSSSPNIAAILAALRGQGGAGGPAGGLNGNTISGGNWQSQPPAPQQWQELANPPLG